MNDFKTQDGAFKVGIDYAFEVAGIQKMDDTSAKEMLGRAKTLRRVLVLLDVEPDIREYFQKYLNPSS